MKETEDGGLELKKLRGLLGKNAGRTGIFKSNSLISGWTVGTRQEKREGAAGAGTGREDGGAMAGVEKLIGVHGKMPTSHATTRGRHRERERSATNSPRRLSSTMRHG